MRRRDGPSRKEKAAEASRLLSGLLRSPKTRPGLIAAVASHGVTKHFVYGILTEWVRTGLVTVLKSGAQPTYQLTEHVVIEQPAESPFPGWMDPRNLPPSSSRAVYIDARLVQKHAMKGVPA